MPYNPDEGNAERWVFKCSCPFGDWVDPEIPPTTNGSLWNPDTLCTTRNYLGWINDIMMIIHVLSALFLFVFACNTWMHLRRKSTKGCCKMKLGLELIMLMVTFALAAVCFSLYVAVPLLKAAGIDHWPVEMVARLLHNLYTAIFVVNTLIVAITWTHVATNARAFRRTTPGTAKFWARIFVGIMVGIVVLGILAQWMVDNATGMLVFIFCAVVVIIVYLVGSCKLQEVIEVQMVGSTLRSKSRRIMSFGRALARISPRHRTRRESFVKSALAKRNSVVKSVAAWTPTIVGKSDTGGTNPRHQHLQTIMQAARAVVACFSAFVVSLMVFATQPQGMVRLTFNFLTYHTAFWIGFVLTRYYRLAIFAGAIRKSKSSTAVGKSSDMRGTGEMSGKVSNSSVVPVAADIEEVAHEANKLRVASVTDRRDRGVQSGRSGGRGFEQLGSAGGNLIAGD